jgi:hypothetical protein
MDVKTQEEMKNPATSGYSVNNASPVGDITNGNLYFFEVNKTRTGLIFDNPVIENQKKCTDGRSLKMISS